MQRPLDCHASHGTQETGYNTTLPKSHDNNAKPRPRIQRNRNSKRTTRHNEKNNGRSRTRIHKIRRRRRIQILQNPKIEQTIKANNNQPKQHTHRKKVYHTRLLFSTSSHCFASLPCYARYATLKQKDKRNKTRSPKRKTDIQNRNNKHKQIQKTKTNIGFPKQKRRKITRKGYRTTK